MAPRKVTLPADNKTSYSDFIQPFLIDHSSIRGRLVRVGKVLNDILDAHNYPLPVSLHLAEQIVLTALLSATLTAEDILTVQAKGDGPVRFMVADAMGGGAMRGYAEVDEEVLKKALAKSKTGTLPGIVGKGYLAVTLDSSGKDNQRYQGIVELKGDTLSEALHAYFVQSQQAEMEVHVAVRPPEKKGGKWHGGGIIIERMPVEGGRAGDFTREEQDDLWKRIGLFVRSLKDSELLDTGVTPQNLLYRLFNEDGVWVYKLQPLKAGCRCSRERVRSVLKTIPEEELLDALDEKGQMVVHCQFCNKREVFTEAQVKRLYGKKPAPKKRK